MTYNNQYHNEIMIYEINHSVLLMLCDKICGNNCFNNVKTRITPVAYPYTH